MTRPHSWPWSILGSGLQLSWPSSWSDRWRWLVRRWAFALTGFVVGLLGVVGWQRETLDAFWKNEVQVQVLKAQLLEHQTHASNRPVASVDLNAPTGPPPVMAWWPVQGSQAEVWLQLEHLFAQHRLRLLSLRPEPASPMGAWLSQAVALRLQGRFEDWVAVWAAMNKRGPVWGIERLRITPEGSGVAIEVVLRLWLSARASGMAGAGPAQGHDALFPSAAPVAWRAKTSASVFVTTPSPMLSSLITAPRIEDVDAKTAQDKVSVQSRDSPQQHLASALQTAPFSADPADWPLEQVRLVGIWQQSDDAQLILMAGPHWVPARVGQRIGTQGHLVHSIHDREVHLRAAQGPIRVIGLEKARP